MAPPLTSEPSPANTVAASTLAHPGLALRRVTPQIVREVLAAPCGFEDMSEQLAVQLVDRLADEVWLLRRAENGSLRDQPEVRRAMLALMSRDRQKRDQVRAIHEGAAQWYNPRPDVTDPPTTENVEAFYHRMCWPQAKHPSSRNTRRSVASQ